MDAALLDRLIETRAAGVPVVLATPLDGAPARLVFPASDDRLAEAAAAALAADRAGAVTTAEGEVFLDPFHPPLRLIVVGAVHIGEFLVRMAALVGFAVTVIDPREVFARADRFADATLLVGWPDEVMAGLRLDGRTAVVALTHDPKIDDRALESALASPAFYVGALGSRRTHAGRLERLAGRGLDAASLSRIRGGPVGLDIGARSPSEIALAVIGEITATLHGVSP